MRQKPKKMRDFNIPTEARAKKNKLIFRLGFVKHNTPSERLRECTEVFKLLKGTYRERIEFIAQYSGYSTQAVYKWGQDYGWKDMMRGVIVEKEGDIVTALSKVTLPSPEQVTVGTVMNLMKMYISLGTSINIDVVSFGYQMISFHIHKLNIYLQRVDYRPDYFTAAEQKKFDFHERKLWFYMEQIAFLIDPSKIAKFANALGLNEAPKSFADVDQTAFTPKYLQEQILKLGIKKNKRNIAAMIQDVTPELLDQMPDVDGRIGMNKKG